MKLSFTSLVGLVLVAQSTSAHYIFDTLIAGSKTSTNAVRTPQENSPVHDYMGGEVRCNVNTKAATETVSVAAGSKIGFKLGENKKVYHLGPAAMYLGKAPNSVAGWDGSGKTWFKIAEWGATFNPFTFVALDKNEFTAAIPPNVPSGEYLVRIEQLGLHQPGTPEFFVSCAQIKITDGGNGSPATVSIPGYISAESDPGLTVDIYWPVPTSYTVPGPEIFYGATVDAAVAKAENSTASAVKVGQNTTSAAVKVAQSTTAAAAEVTQESTGCNCKCG